MLVTPLQPELRSGARVPYSQPFRTHFLPKVVRRGRVEDPSTPLKILKYKNYSEVKKLLFSSHPSWEKLLAPGFLTHNTFGNFHLRLLHAFANPATRPVGQTRPQLSHVVYRYPMTSNHIFIFQIQTGVQSSCLIRES